MAEANSVVAISNGQGAVDAYNRSVENLQKNIPLHQQRIADMQASLVKKEAQLANLLANPVVLHA